MSPAETSAVAMAVYPFALFAFLVALAAIRYLVIKHFPESRLKRFLLKDV